LAFGAAGGRLLVGAVSLGILAGGVAGVLLARGAALLVVPLPGLLAAGVGVVAGLLVGLASLLLDPLAVALGGLRVLVAGPALAVAASPAAGAGGQQLLGLEEAIGALLRILEEIGLALDREREVVEDLALGVQRGVEVAVRGPLLVGAAQLLLRGGVLPLLQQ